MPGDESSAPAEAALSRDAHLFAPGPKRILALDGGGVRGIVALAFLERFERLLAEAAGRKVKLCEYFDLIGGTSTGAIIASGLALGFEVQEIRDFYMRLAPKVFRPPFLPLPGWSAIFDAEKLAQELSGVLGDRTLDSPDLLTGFAVTLKRLDTGSAWILMNNPRSKFWETPEDKSHIGNRHYLLSKIVRASTAAPHYFDPQEIEIVEGEPPGLFVDGGLTPHNTPALALWLAVIIPAYGLSWPSGPDKLSVYSVGAGTFREQASASSLIKAPSASLALRALRQQIGDGSQLALTLLTLFGRSPTPWVINSEIGDLGQVQGPCAPLYTFYRYDVRLEIAAIKANFDVDVSEKELSQLRRLDDASSMPQLYEFARKAAEAQVKAEHFRA